MGIHTCYNKSEEEESKSDPNLCVGERCVVTFKMENNVAEMKLATLQSIEVYRDDVAVVIEVSQMKQYQIITFMRTSKHPGSVVCLGVKFRVLWGSGEQFLVRLKSPYLYTDREWLLKPRPSLAVRIDICN